VLHVHRSSRADGLIDALGALLAGPQADPFAPEVVSVPTRGMERWIAQRLSAGLGASPGRSDGVCANVAFPTPRRLVGDAVAGAADVDPDEDPWLPERAVWPLLDVVGECLDEPWLEVLAAHLGAAGADPDPLRGARRFATVRHLAELFDSYALHRPEVVRGWAASPSRAEEHWQGRLWRCLRARIARPGPAERLAEASARLRREPDVLDLPQRISLFGITRLPAGYRDVLGALAARREVHLFLLHPSPALWREVAATLARSPAVRLRREDPTAAVPANALLASWGRDAREMQVVLSAADVEIADHEHRVAEDGDTLLARIQADVRADRRPPGEPLGGAPDGRPALAPGDRSLQIHACHGRARQVQVLRDAILHMLADDPTLEPRDVIVMCPDIEVFAPLIHATFGAHDPVDEDDELTDGSAAQPRAPDLRVRLADRSLRQTNPVLGVVAQLLELADDRVTASQVLDLAGREPVRHRFRFGDDDLVRLGEWVAESGIRWGLDAAHRTPFALQEVESGTWEFGLSRVLVGVTMTDDDRRLVHDVLPLDDVDSGSIDLAGRFAELLDRLGRTLDTLRAPKTLDAWAAAIAQAADLLTDSREREAWQRAELQRLLDDAATESRAAHAGDATELALQEIRALLADRLRGRPTRANFRTGHLTICTLVPMRSVPHRVVCLLGLDDAHFPRKAPRDGDDLLLVEPHVGERDPRAEDRQLLLDALMAAREQLVITYTGNDERTNAVRPPAVPVGELLDVVDRTVRSPEPSRLPREHVLVRHPLQPFDPRNFTPGQLGGATPWSFDRATLAGARALTMPRPPAPPFLAQPLHMVRSPVVSLDELVRFVGHPVRAFLRGRLELSVGDYSTDVEDALPVALDALEKWDVGQQLLDALLAGADGRAACRAELARGMLPPGVLAKPILEELWPTVEAIHGEAVERLGDGAATSVEVRTDLPDGRVLGGTVAGVRGDVLSTVLYARVSPKHRLAAWVRLLALSAAHPERPWSALTVGRAREGDGMTVATIPPLGADGATRRAEALELLGELIDLYDRALCEPLPLPCKTAARYARAIHAGEDTGTALMRARRAWESDRYDEEDRDAEHILAFGGEREWEDLSREPPREDEHGPGWDEAQPSRLGRLSMRLWRGLLEREEVADHP
jgi:exodeoxyribonuclease V gamma subunit